MNRAIKSQQYKDLFQLIFELYHQEENKSKLLFHGWHHAKFVHDKAIEFAKELDVNIEIVASAALVHDLNYIFTDKLEPEAAAAKITEYLGLAKFNSEDTDQILSIIKDAHMEYRSVDSKISLEAQALADADTLFKALPTTPILFASKFISQNKYDIAKLAKKVVVEQEPLIMQDKYFYTDLAKKKYSKWANTSFDLWKNVLESLDDESVMEMLKTAEELGIM